MVFFLGPYYNTGPNLGDPKRDHNFDNPPYLSHNLNSLLEVIYEEYIGFRVQGSGFRV